MRRTKDRALVGVFDSADEARQAIRELRDAGVSDRKIGLVTKDAHGEPAVQWFRELEGNRGGIGAAAGAVAGAGGGALWALGIELGAFPALGPIEGGIVAAFAASAAAGAVAGLAVGMLAGKAIRDEEKAYYRQELARGRTMVLVEGERRVDLVRSVFRAHAAVDHEIMTPAETQYVERRTPARRTLPYGAARTT